MLSPLFCLSLLELRLQPELESARVLGRENSAEVRSRRHDRVRVVEVGAVEHGELLGAELQTEALRYGDVQESEAGD